jgi:tetratricopeptide (TPR) repeat protein
VTEQQSEHLSNAQIENYGNQTSGAGPDADQRDEDQREDQWVDAHLADCPSCRSRLLDFQRTHFALLANAKLAKPALAGSKLGDPKLADPQLNTASTPECPSEDDLRQVAAGLCPDAVAAMLTHHAATCDHCGPMLRTYTEDFSDDFSPEEQAVLANLQSSSASWQKKTARQMLSAAGVRAADASAAGLSAGTDVGVREDARAALSDRKPSANLGRKPFFWKWILVPATAAICALVAFGIWYSQHDTPEKVEKLLAQAYTEQRTMEMRWPGAAYSTLASQQRGGSGQHPASLFQAKSIILDHLNARRDDSRWLHALGREEILEWRTEDALNDLKHALELSPNSVPIMVDLAIAHFQRAERAQNTVDYTESVELLGKALATRPDDPNVLFNRALLYQKMSPPLYESALNDWNHFLAIEPQGLWSEEARRHKREIEELKKNSSATN